jgi:hypothetical protein
MGGLFPNFDLLTKDAWMIKSGCGTILVEILDEIS